MLSVPRWIALSGLVCPQEPDVNADVVRFPHLSASLDLGQITTFTFISRDDRDKEACPDMLPYTVLAVRDLNVIAHFPPPEF